MAGGCAVGTVEAVVIPEDSDRSHKLPLATDFTRRRILKRFTYEIDLAIDINLRHDGMLLDRRGPRSDLRFGSVGRTSILRVIDSALSVDVRTRRRPETFPTALRSTTGQSTADLYRRDRYEPARGSV